MGDLNVLGGADVSTRCSPKQYVRDGVAAKIRAAPDVSRARPRRVVWRAEARAKILKGQAIFLSRLLEALADHGVTFAQNVYPILPY